MTKKDDQVIQSAVEVVELLPPPKKKVPAAKPREVRVKSGVHEQLEAIADALIFGSLKDVTSREEKSDILTPWKEKNRKSREILSRTGHPIDGALRRGMYHRAYNNRQTHLNSYDGTGSGPIKMSASWDDDSGEPISNASPAMKMAFGVERDE